LIFKGRLSEKIRKLDFFDSLVDCSGDLVV
jgi:hypothetical protein